MELQATVEEDLESINSKLQGLNQKEAWFGRWGAGGMILSAQGLLYTPLPPPATCRVSPGGRIPFMTKGGCQ